jgi:Protein of unknown function (DUF2844)
MKLQQSSVLAAILSIVCGSQIASATLGQDQTTIEADRLRLGAVRQSAVQSAAVMRAAVTRAFSVQQMSLTDGTAVREYVSASGVVFGVAWQGTSIPPLAQVLGDDLLARTQAGFEAVRATRTGRGPLSIETSDVVFHSGGHPQAFFGNAYVPKLLPAGVSPADIQ